MKQAVLLLFLLMAMPGCRQPDNCVPKSTRCAGNVAELCNANRNWQTQLDCDRVTKQSGAAFVCVDVNEQTEDGLVQGHTCSPAGVAGAAGTTVLAGSGGAS